MDEVPFCRWLNGFGWRSGVSRGAGLRIAMGGCRSSGAEVFEVDDGGFDDLELGCLSERG